MLNPYQLSVFRVYLAVYNDSQGCNKKIEGTAI
jgi:hypothetical protein